MVLMFAPAQESSDRSAPVLHCRRCKSALASHPCDVLVQFVLVLKRDDGLAPPAKEPQPWSPDIENPSRGGGRTMKALTVLSYSRQRRHIDAVAGIQVEAGSNPKEFVALHFKHSGLRTVL